MLLLVSFLLIFDGFTFANFLDSGVAERDDSFLIFFEIVNEFCNIFSLFFSSLLFFLCFVFFSFS
jgi:hypothetical protein